jgi:hypothetical protein
MHLSSWFAIVVLLFGGARPAEEVCEAAPGGAGDVTASATAQHVGEHGLLGIDVSMSGLRPKTLYKIQIWLVGPTGHGSMWGDPVVVESNAKGELDVGIIAATGSLHGVHGVTVLYASPGATPARAQAGSISI